MNGRSRPRRRAAATPPRLLWLLDLEPGSSREEEAAALHAAAAAAGWSIDLVLPWRAARRPSAFDLPPAVDQRWVVEVQLGGGQYRGEVRLGRSSRGAVYRVVPQAADLAPPSVALLLAWAALDVARREGHEVAWAWGPRAALLPVLLATRLGAEERLAGVRVVAVVDSGSDAGWLERASLRDLGLPEALLEPPLGGDGARYSTTTGLAVFADRVIVPGARAARDLLRVGHGAAAPAADGLGRALRERGRDVVAVTWGIDRRRWDPEHDPALPAPFSAADPAGRAVAGDALRRRLGWRAGDSGAGRGRPLVVVVDSPEGHAGAASAAVEVASAWMAGKGGGPCDWLFMGPLDGEAERRVEAMVAAAPARCARWAGTAAEDRRLAFAAADLALFVASSDALGHGVRQAARYGAVPVVFASAGALEAVGPTGLAFRQPTPMAVRRALAKALAIWGRAAEWKRLQQFAFALPDPGPLALRRIAAAMGESLDREPRRVEIPVAPRPALEAPDTAPPAPPAEPFIDWGPSLPQRYGEDVLELMVQGPHSLYAYWEIADAVQATAAGPLRLVLRGVRGATELGAGVGDVGDWWIAADPAQPYVVELRAGDGRLLLRSAIVRTPRAGASPHGEVEFVGRGRGQGARRAAATDAGASDPGAAGGAASGRPVAGDWQAARTGDRWAGDEWVDATALAPRPEDAPGEAATAEAAAPGGASAAPAPASRRAFGSGGRD